MIGKQIALWNNNLTTGLSDSRCKDRELIIKGKKKRLTGNDKENSRIVLS